MMTKKETAKDIIKNYFPKEITETMDFDTLKISKDTFIDKKNRKNESDILYEIMINKVKTYIYLLFEHKSYDYKYTALQLLRYMYNIWDLDIKQKRLTKNKKLQPIIPFVVYANDKEWTRENTLSYLLDTIPAPVKKHVPDYEYLMLNLQVKDFDEIKGELLTQIMLKTMKIVFMNDVDLEERLREILHLIKLYKNVENTQETLEVFRLFIRYLTRAAKYIKKEQLEKSVQKELPEWRSDYMTIADVLRKEGKEEGREEEKKETDINLYKMGLTLDQIAQGTGLDKETLQEILKNVER
jgi:predicted transposase/invertase (TIGR01784 family)